jgi:hypothetical protein
MTKNEESIRPAVRVLAREMSEQDIASVVGGMKCAPTAGASGTANWDASVDDGVGF